MSHHYEETYEPTPRWQIARLNKVVSDLSKTIEQLEKENLNLYLALVKFVGTKDKKDLEGMKKVIETIAPPDEKEKMFMAIDAILHYNENHR